MAGCKQNDEIGGCILSKMTFILFLYKQNDEKSL